MPIVVYPDEYINELRGEIDDVKAKLKAGEQPISDDIDDLFAKLEED